MAIVQISRIQHRRGRKLTSGMPQLASGEIGWAVDTQELYIGNGAVSEGAPSVGNTKILTEHDDLFSIADQYSYKKDISGVQTGFWDGVTPVGRLLQERLDDFVSVKSFGAQGDGSTNDTTSINNALELLFLHGEVDRRAILYFPPGEYVIDNTVYIPPHAVLRGSGKDKTIIRMDPASGLASSNPAIKLVNGTWNGSSSSTTTPYDDVTPNQPRFIDIQDMSIEVNGPHAALYLQECVFSVFKNLRITSEWTFAKATSAIIAAGTYDYSHGINLAIDPTSAATVTIKNNIFENIEIDGFQYPVYSDCDIKYNHIKDCTFSTALVGVAFGENTAGNYGQPGFTTGPTFNTVEGCTFEDIYRQGFSVTYGEYNLSKSNRYIAVGNEGGSESTAAFPIISFSSHTNSSDLDYFERFTLLSLNNDTGAATYDIIYPAEVEGSTNVRTMFNNQIQIPSDATWLPVLKFPAPENGVIYVDYTYTANLNNSGGGTADGCKQGTFEITCNRNNNIVGFNDVYDYTDGTIDTASNAIAMQFRAGYVALNTVGIECSNSLPINTGGYFNYTIRVKS